MDLLQCMYLDSAAEEEEYEQASGAMVALVGGAILGRLQRNERRRPNRTGLLRRHLMPHPQFESPWWTLYNSGDRRGFITTMGFDPETFQFLLDSGFEEAWNDWTIPREDVSSAGRPRLGARSLNAAGALGLVLHYLSSSVTETNLELIFALTPSTTSRYLERGQEILFRVVSQIPEGEISMPSSREEYEYLSDLITHRHPLLVGAFGSIDGLSLPCQESDDPEIENATYNSWKSSHRINNVIVFSPEGTIMMAVLNCPGSWHDSRVAMPIFEYLAEYVPPGFYLAGDSGFPKGTGRVAGKLVTPLKQGDTISGDPEEQARILAYNRNLISYRQTAEWGMRTLQGSFGRLRVPLEINDKEKRLRLLQTCCHLTNIRARKVGISQIRNVYVPLWRESEDERLWRDWSNMVFGEIRQRDRVARFHLVVRET